MKNSVQTMLKRELSSYLLSPIAYIVGCLFLVFSGLLFFSTFFLLNRAELRGFFSLLPVLLSFFVPAITMRLFAEEKRIGSFETLLTLPVTPLEIVTAKFIAGVVSSIALLLPTLFYVLTASSFGKVDAGPIIGGYLGALFLISSFTAIGLFASSVTKNQIIAFFVSFALCAVLAFMSSFLILLPSPLVSLLGFFSATSHFDSIARGIIDTRDLLYFLSVTAVFFGFTVKSIQNGMRG